LGDPFNNRPHDTENYYRTYRAVGTVTFGSQTFVGAPVEIQQTQLGRTHFRCDVPSFDMNEPDVVSRAPIRIEGKTENGLNFKGQSANDYDVRPGQTGVVLSFDVRSLSLTSATPANTTVYHLTNLNFMGVEKYIEEGDGWMNSGLGISLDCGGVSIEVRPLLDEVIMASDLSARQTAGITAKAIVCPSDDTESDKDEEEAVHGLCRLLSFVSGTTVTWVFRDSLDTQGQLVRGDSRHVRLKEYVDARILDTSNGHILKEFLVDAYPKLQDVEREWDFRNALDLFIDAKATDEALPSKGLKVVVCLELLKAAYLARHPEQEHIVARTEFKKRRKSNQAMLDSSLRALFGEDTPEELMSKLRLKLSELNRTSFREVLTAMCEAVGLDKSEKELKHFVAVRNRLVHRGNYFDKDSEHGKPVRQFMFISHFMNDFFLSLLGYTGPTCYFVDAEFMALNPLADSGH
jgi:hypothetical protein